jgi:hypothetical protein
MTKGVPMARRDVVADRVTALIKDFDRYLAVYDARPTFRPDQLSAHRDTIELRRRAGSAAAAAADPVFAASLHRTLRSWGLGVRASVLLPGPMALDRRQERADGQCQPSRTRAAMCRASAA